MNHGRLFIALDINPWHCNASLDLIERCELGRGSVQCDGQVSLYGELKCASPPRWKGANILREYIETLHQVTIQPVV